MQIDKLGPYRVVRLLGEGGMGLVFEALHEQIGRRAAIKLMHPALASQGQLARRFLTEARSANLVRHPGIVEIFDIGQRGDGTPYLVMEFLDGESLWARLCRVGRLDEATVLAMAGQIASALRAAHDKGVIHRDLKPDNIMIVKDPLGPGGERVKLLDFGIAKLLFDEISEETLGAAPPDRPGPLRDERLIPPRGTRAGDSLGTMTYMAPEQHLDPRRVTAAADVFSLGVTLYEALCAGLPFPPFGSLVSDAVPLRQRAPEVSQKTADLIARMLQREPQARPTLPEIEAALHPTSTSPGPRPRPSSGPSSAPLAARAPGRAPRLVAGLLAGLLCAGAGVGAVVYLQRSRQRAPAALRLSELRREALRLLVADLRLPEAPARRSALAALAHGPDLAPAPDAERLLADPAHEVREQAVETLGRLGDLAVLPALRARLDGDPAPPVRLAVAAALDQLGDGQGIRRLQAALAGPDPALRLRAALLLAPRGNAAALELLRGVLAQPLPEDAELAVRTRLALAGDGAARAALLGRLDATEPLSRRLNLAATLARLGEERGLALLRKVAAGPAGGGEQLLATRLLISLSEPVQAEALRQVLRLPERAAPAAARLLAAEALGECEQADAELLAPLALSRAAEPALRHAAAAALLRLGAVLGQLGQTGQTGMTAEGGLRWAQQALLSDQPALREAAVAVLADAASGEAVPLLAARLQKDPSPAVRREAARSLSWHPGTQALAQLDAALADPDAEVRGEVLRALGTVDAALREGGQGETLSPARQRALAQAKDEAAALRRGLADGDWQARFRAARALAGRGDPSAAPVLREALER
jgi:HEAT repeat protein/tRNA A-37 threonylcarbamoyl transferase component Bud32